MSVFILLCCSSVAKSCLTLCNPMDCTKLSCPSPSPRVCSNSCALSLWCHLTISPSLAPFCSCPQSFSASEFSNKLALHIRWSKYRSFGLSIHPSNDYSGLVSFRIDWFDLPVSKELSRVFSSNTFLFILIAVTCIFSRHTFYGEFLL